MHIHGSQTKLNPVNPYSAAAERAIAAQRAADRAKKLIKSAKGIEGTPSPEEASLLANWMDSSYSQTLSVVEYHTPTAGKDSNFG
jgi:hypothetical protein